MKLHFNNRINITTSIDFYGDIVFGGRYLRLISDNCLDINTIKHHSDLFSEFSSNEEDEWVNALVSSKDYEVTITSN